MFTQLACVRMVRRYSSTAVGFPIRCDLCAYFAAFWQLFGHGWARLCVRACVNAFVS